MLTTPGCRHLTAGWCAQCAPLPTTTAASFLALTAEELAARRKHVREEMTRDVVFLFQWRRGEGRWETEGVWLSRDEAEAWGYAHAYRWPDGWRVFGVPAEGRLAQVLGGGS